MSTQGFWRCPKVEETVGANTTDKRKIHHPKTGS